MPRKRTTNRSAFVQLRNEINNLKQEVSPVIRVKGGTFTTGPLANGTPTAANQALIIHRKITRHVDAAADAATDFSASDIRSWLGTGAVLTKIVVKAINARSFTAIIDQTPAVSGTGDIANQRRYVAAPIGRFPTLVVDIPDAHAKALAADATRKILTLQAKEATQYQYVFSYYLSYVPQLA